MSTDDPNALSPAAKPIAVIVWAASLYFLMGGVLALALLFEELRQGSTVMASWTVLGLSYGVPCALVAGAVAVSRERLLEGRVRRGRLWWVALAAGSFLLVHWSCMLAWTPIALLGALLSHGSQSESLAASALAGMVAWVAVLVALAMVTASRAALRKRQLQGGVPPSWQGLAIPHVLASTGLAGLLVAPVMFVGTGAVAAGGDGGAMATPMVLTLGGAGLIAGVGLAWSGASAEIVAAGQRNSWRESFLTYLGGFLVVQWMAVLVVTLLPAMWSVALGQRFGMQMAAVVGLAIGAALVGRRLAGPAGYAH